VSRDSARGPDPVGGDYSARPAEPLDGRTAYLRGMKGKEGKGGERIEEGNGRKECVELRHHLLLSNLTTGTKHLKQGEAAEADYDSEYLQQSSIVRTSAVCRQVLVEHLEECDVDEGAGGQPLEHGPGQRSARPTGTCLGHGQTHSHARRGQERQDGNVEKDLSPAGQRLDETNPGSEGDDGLVDRHGTRQQPHLQKNITASLSQCHGWT